ncbi:MAG: hypothetical protein E7331_02180 [Clostridiales bacterium]|nr:hypothetical protein [Clostridiales bacterium]
MMHPIYRYRDDDYRFTDSRRPEGQGASCASQPIERRRSRRQPAGVPYQEERPRSAYYTPLEDDRREIPANPYASTAPRPEPPRPQRTQPEKSSFFAEDGSEFEAPAMPQLPEWYRIAQQNAAPPDERRRNTPMVKAATVFEAEEGEPQRDALGRPLRRNMEQAANIPTSREAFYERAGYPKELILEQQRISEEESMIQNRKRHGAMRAAPAPRESAPEPAATAPRRRPLTEQERMQRAEAVRRYQLQQESVASAYPDYYAQTPPQRQYHPPRTENEYPQPAPKRDRHDDSYEEYEEYYEEEMEVSPLKTLKTWIIIGVFAAALIAAVLFALQVHYADETNRVLDNRRRAEERILQQYPIEYQEWIEREAAKNNLNPAFVSALIMNESSYRPRAESNVGARGLMQVMEPTAADIAEELGMSNYSFDMLYDPETNIIFGCHYLGQLSKRFRGDPVCVAAAYHAGAQQVQNWLNSSKYSSDGWTLNLDNMADGPTKQYAIRVTRDFAIYQRLYFSDQEGK